MSEDPVTLIAERLRNLPEGGALALKMRGAHYADDYLAALASVFRDFATETQAYSIYVSVTNPSTLVRSLLESLDIPPERVFFVDAISQILMAGQKKIPNASYVESPTMLENIMLRVEYFLRKNASPRKLVFLDSVNSLAIHNDPAILSEFFHILVNNLKSRGVTIVILAVAEETGPEMENILGLVCDDTVRFGDGSEVPS
jgi:hypothetical protein